MKRKYSSFSTFLADSRTLASVRRQLKYWLAPYSWDNGDPNYFGLFYLLSVRVWLNFRRKSFAWCMEAAK